MRFFTADQHFGHANILKFQPENRVDGRGRPFKSVGHMDDFLVQRWNEVVSEGDEVYCVGDFSYKANTTREVLPRLKGRKFLIVGNHDPFFKRVVNGKINEARELAREIGFSELYINLDLELPGVGQVHLSHFPYHPENVAELTDYDLRYLHLRPKVGQELCLFHGHVHSQWRQHRYGDQPMMVNVGVDMWGLQPVPEQALVDLMAG